MDGCKIMLHLLLFLTLFILIAKSDDKDKHIVKNIYFKKAEDYYDRKYFISGLGRRFDLGEITRPSSKKVYPNSILTRDPTVVVNVPNRGDVTGYSAVDTGYVPVNAYSNYGTRPIGGTYNSVPNSGPTVIVNVPENEYDNTLDRGYSRTNVFGVPANRRRI